VELLVGPHISADVAVIGGEPVWFSFAKGYPLAGGTFDYWEILPSEIQPLQSDLAAFIQENFHGYSGMMNFETIDGKIIEMHLRFADQWPDLYGEWFVPALIGLYHEQVWPSATAPQRPAYSVVLFGPHRDYKKPDETFLAGIRTLPGISSIQTPFHEGKPPELHSMPPGGFRMAIVNGFDLAAAQTARERIRQELIRLSGD